MTRHRDSVTPATPPPPPGDTFQEWVRFFIAFGLSPVSPAFLAHPQFRGFQLLQLGEGRLDVCTGVCPVDSLETLIASETNFFSVTNPLCFWAGVLGVTVFSWEVAEALAVAHMKQLGFLDARPTQRGADGGLDVVSSDAAAQVKALAVPVGAPDVQKLRGAAHGYKTALFYSQAGYTSQAFDYAGEAGVGLFRFDSANEVTPDNDIAERLVQHPSGQLDTERALNSIERTKSLSEDLQDLSRLIQEWLKLSPWPHMIPQDYLDQRVPELELVVTRLALLVTGLASDALKTSAHQADQAAKKLSEEMKEAVATIGELLDIDIRGMAPREAAQTFRATLRGETSRLRIKQLRPKISEKFNNDFEAAWNFFLPSVACLIRAQKFLKIANAEANKIQKERSIDFETEPSSKKAWKGVPEALEPLQAWWTGVESGEGTALEGERHFLELVGAFDSLLSPFGMEAHSLLALADSKPATWLDDETDS